MIDADELVLLFINENLIRSMIKKEHNINLNQGT